MSQSRRKKASAEEGRSKRKKARPDEDEEPRKKKKKKKKAGEETDKSRRKKKSAESQDPDKKQSSRRKRSKAKDDDGEDTGKKTTSRRKRARDDEDASEDSGRKRSSRRKRSDDDEGGKSGRKSSRRGETGRSRRRSRDDDDEMEDEGGGGGMGKIFLIILIVAGGAAAAFFALKPPTLPDLLAALDKYKAPKNPYDHKHQNKFPLKGLISFGKEAVKPCEDIVLDTSRKSSARIGAAIVLGRIHSRDGGPDPASSIDALCKAMFGDEKVGWNAGAALARIGEKTTKAPNAVGAYAMSAPTANGSIACLNLLLRFKNRPKTIPAFRTAATTHKNPDVRLEAVKLLSQVVQPEAAIAQALALDDKDANVREAAFAALGGRPPLELLKAGKKLIGNEKPEKRRLAMLIVRGVGERARELLEKGLADKDLGVATSAAPGLAPIMPPDHATRGTFVSRIQELLGAAKNDDHLRDLGQAAGRSKMSELENHFENWLGSGTKGQRIASVEALEGMSEDAWVGSHLIPYIEDADKDVAQVVVLALRRVFVRGVRKWAFLHMPAESNRRKPPKNTAQWKVWWTAQKWILEEDHKQAKEVKEALELMAVKPPSYSRLAKAQKLLEAARERLIQIGEKNGWEQDSRIIKLNSFIQMSIKNRPAHKDN